MSKITIEAVEAAKAKHDKIYVVEIDMSERNSISDQENEPVIFDTSGKLAEGENIYRAIVKKPDNRVKGLAMTQKDPVQMGNIILKNCIVEADDEILQDEDVNFAAAMQCVKLVTVGQGMLKKF